MYELKDFIERIIAAKNGKQGYQQNVLHVIPVELSKQIPYSKSDGSESGSKGSEPRYFLRIDKQKLPNVKDFGKVHVSHNSVKNSVDSSDTFSFLG